MGLDVSPFYFKIAWLLFSLHTTAEERKEAGVPSFISDSICVSHLIFMESMLPPLWHNVSSCRYVIPIALSCKNTLLTERPFSKTQSNFCIYILSKLILLFSNELVYNVGYKVYVNDAN